MTADQFRNLTNNETEFLRWIKEAKAQFAYYTEPQPTNVPVAPTK